MAEYIEREATCKDCTHYSVCEDKLFGSNHKNCRHFTNKADVVEVVRCKDCKYSCFVKSCSKYECKKGCGTLKYSNDFCSYGEAKMDGKVVET